ncbi:hypothetical protein BBJ28_00003495 [Nothophytophthora sp. Chile5]|nr:hypothetical protein BBJ28_00003495 [Nothophytophthora sp. Chile5]
MAAYWVYLRGSGAHLLASTAACFSSASRQCYSVLSSVPSFLPSRKALAPRPYRAPPPPLPTPQYLKIHEHCTFEYIEITPSVQTKDEGCVTLVLIHGAPGSYRDFRYLLPLLAKHPQFRIIAINLPGYGDSTVAKTHYLESISALPTAELTLDAVRELCGGHKSSGNVFLVGHSFGAHTVINMAALNASEMATTAINFRGIALLAPAGCVPHRTLKLGPIALLVNLLRSGNPLIVSAATHLVKLVYTKFVGFPSNSSPGPFVGAVMRAGTTDFALIREQVAALGNLQIPTLIAWSQRDEHIQIEVPEELGRLCHAGPRIAFAGGGHNIQKTRAEQVAAALKEWIERVVAGEEAKEMMATRCLP